VQKLICPILSVLILITALVVAQDPNPAVLRQQAQQRYKDGNWKDAYESYRKLCLNKAADSKKVGNDLRQALYCLQRLNRVNEVDTFREKVIDLHQNKWRVLRDAAQTYLHGQHYGYLVAGEFKRGHHRGGGRYVNSFDRDRVRALQLMNQALVKSENEKSTSEVAQFNLQFAQMVMTNRGGGQAWRLQTLTDLSKLPDYNQPYYGHSTAGTPVDEKGNPVYHHLPQTFGKASSDGQRWRWLLANAVELNPQLKTSVDYQFAMFWYQQLGVQTIASYARFFRWGRAGHVNDKDKDKTGGAYAVHTLEDDETIAKLATGVKRLKIPDEFNYVRIFKRLAASKNSSSLMMLAQIHQNRRQLDEAAKYWKLYRPFNPNHADRQISQILDNWGTFEATRTHPAGAKPKIDYRYRNGSKVSLEAFVIDVKALLGDTMAYIKSDPQKWDSHKANPSSIGYRLVQNNENKYVGKSVAKWDMKLDADKQHWDRRVTIQTPMTKPGAYLLRAKMGDGNISRVIVWVNDTVIVRKALQKQILYYVADAVSGEPVQGAKMEFFGYRRERLRNVRPAKYRVSTQVVTRKTDKDGTLIFAENELPRDRSWLVTAMAEGHFAYSGFEHIWYASHHDYEYNQIKSFGITDRPVYRPGHEVKFKVWTRHAKYDLDDVSSFAGRGFNVEIRDPKGKTIFTKGLKADDFGGVNGTFELGEKATLGVYHLMIHGGVNRRSAVSFRVEEYKKPEFEVKIEAPTEPVMLGEKITGKIQAKYYFGSPVTNATVKYKILRTEHDGRWFPTRHWDWLFQPGYWWHAYDYNWYPGWAKWGCRAPIGWWWPRSHRQPEVVAERTAKIGEDGTIDFEIDTALAKAIRGDSDHKYTITAEVRDQSRRTIVGSGEVLVAREPFKVYAWVTRGHYRTGDTVQAQFKAQTLDSKPVKGAGKLRLLRLTYKEDGTPIETPVQQWNLNTDVEGAAQIKIQAAKAGQYRLSYTVTDAKEHKIEGGYVFMVRGAGDDGSNYRFSKIELITERDEYNPGEKIRLMINTDKKDATVLLFVRPANGVYLPPKIVRLKGKSSVEEIAVVQKDMPNFYIEALTIYDGKLHTETRQVIVPPSKRVIKVKVLASKEAYKPGEKAKMRIQLTDYQDKPITGSVVLSGYDRSVEYISGGSNVPEIQAFFWKWRRHHRPQTFSTLSRYFSHLAKRGEIRMGSIGVFGHLVTEGKVGNEKGEVAKPMAAAAPGRGRAMKSSNAAFGDAVADAESAPAERLAQAGKKNKRRDGGGAAAAGGLVQPTVRTKFADTAVWVASVTTDAKGIAEIGFVMPENLTGWKIKAWAVGHGTMVGEGQVEVVTRKDLLVRLQAPRFFTEKDEVILSANVHNYLKAGKEAKVVLELDGGTLVLMKGYSPTQTVTIKPNGEARINWRVKVIKEGTAIVRMKALTDEESDAMEMSFPVYVHGMMKQVPRSGVIRPNGGEATIGFNVPKDRRPNESRLELRFSPTLAGAMVDALPYLSSYPYGCTEQTLNRFLPTVITQRILKDRLKVNLADIRNKKTNLNAQEIGDPAKRAAQWKDKGRRVIGYKENGDPIWSYDAVWSEESVADMVRVGIEKLGQMQLQDGGWGWFSGFGERSYAHTTATVVRGLLVAESNGVKLPKGMLDRGISWLKKYQAGQWALLELWDRTEGKKGKRFADNLDTYVYMVLVDSDADHRQMRERIYRDRNKISVYAKAMFGMALHKMKDQPKLAMIMKNISQFVVEDDENQTAYLNLPGGYWWYWYGSEMEAHAYYLKLLSKTDPKGRVASRMVKYLLNNRKHSTYWNSTRDTALCVEALAEYMVASGEDAPDMTVEIYYDGRLSKTVKITKDNLFTFDNGFVLEGDKVTTGKHTVQIKRKGKGPVYFNGYLDYFSLEDFITKEGLEIKINRNVYRLEEVTEKKDDAGARGQIVGRKVTKYKRHKLANLDEIDSGDLIEVELVIESKNDYEYILIEDRKASGFEPTKVRSGYNGNSMGAYVEYRDERVSFFVRALARGKHSVSYRLRAETPGKVSALPARAYAMYAPELKANSDEIKLNVKDDQE
jgi:uncharacterized protein YfaS (alpha-2-macroglobulin family)